jgi:3-mercaptopyruvate sulfurtransferase SseA
MLIDRGYRKVRPLAGGLDAWIDAGCDVEVFVADASRRDLAAPPALG